MKTGLVALILSFAIASANAAGGRYACKPGNYTLSFDFGAKTLTLDGQTAAMTQGAVTWRANVGGHEVVVAPSDRPATRIFDISIDRGATYGGFVVCKAI